jgi:hypothetical protein
MVLADGQIDRYSIFLRQEDELSILSVAVLARRENEGGEWFSYGIGYVHRPGRSEDVGIPRRTGYESACTTWSSSSIRWLLAFLGMHFCFSGLALAAAHRFPMTANIQRRGVRDEDRRARGGDATCRYALRGQGQAGFISSSGLA